MENLSDILEKLRISLALEKGSTEEDQHPPDKELIRAVLDRLKRNEEVILDSEIQKILPLLKLHLENCDITLTASLLELTAELCKSENARQACVNAGLISSVVNCIENQHPDVVLQTFRAMGNIACDNNQARKEIFEAGGVQKIIDKLKELQNMEAIKYESKHHATACGAVLNMCFEYQILQRELIQGGTIPLLLRYVKHNMDDKRLALMAANAVSCLVDMEEGVSSFISSRGCETFVKALKFSTGELSSTLTECLQALSEKDNIKQALLSENCVDILQEIISLNMSINNEDDVVEKLKLCVDLIVLLLGDDYCLGELFADEKTAFIDKILLWTQSSEAYVRNSCPVAIGNIARTETNCIRLVKMDIHCKLINLLKNDSQNNEADQMQLQQSILSALKNLAIPASNKRVLIDSGALDCAVQLLRSPNTPSPLLFRATSVIRLLVQGQDDAVDTVCLQEECLKNLVALSQNSGIEGVKSEASRLLATLLKNARKSESILAVVKNDGLLPVVAMILSMHPVMQNEALVGIVLAVNIITNEYAHKIDESNLLDTLSNVLNGENIEPQTQYNLIAVIEALFIKGLVEKTKLEDTSILQNLQKLTTHSHDAIKQRATTVMNKIKYPDNL